MPTFIHGKTSGVLLNQFDLSAYFNSVDTSQSIDTAEITGFGASAKAYIPGLVDGTLSLSGMYSQDATVGSDVVLSTILGTTTTPIVTVPMETGTIGKRAIVAKAHETNYSISNPVGDVVSVTADFNASTDGTSNVTYGLRTGVMLTAGSSIAFGSLATGLTSVDNTASSASGGFANLHVTVNTLTGPTTSIKVQHSTDNSTWADLITFTALVASTTTSQQSAVSGTVNRYLRAIGTAGPTAGAVTYHISFARF
jgi:hypothetical protein